MEKEIAGYAVRALVKTGSVGAVYRVVDARGRTLALKRISADNGADRAKLRRFRKEFDVQKRCDHPGIIKVHDYVDSPPQDFFTMEYFESESLKHAIFELPDRVNRREFRILRQLAETLQHVHERGLIHKDLKPENVLINEGGSIRLIDFSLAQTRWDRWLQFGRHAEGTPFYMAPEQIRGGRCDARTDAYAFGLVAYELMTKRMPFSGKDHDAYLRAHLKVAAPPMSDHVRTVEPELDALVLQLLEKEPSRRPRDLCGVVRELAKWENADPALRRHQVRMLDAPRPVPDPFKESLEF